MKTEDFKQLLQAGPVKFVFTKKDGSNRPAIGTLNLNYIPENFYPKDSSVLNSNKNLKYFDLEKNEWRSISKDVDEIDVIK